MPDGGGTRRFRSSWTYMEGFNEAIEVQCRITALDLNAWTVDCVSVFDRKFFPGIQVGSPYLNFYNGEGIYAFPEVGAKCMVTIPSDSTPPFVSSFVMPTENVDMTSEEAPTGTAPSNLPPQKAGSPTYAGGRPRVKPGDIWMRGRDGNFVIVHRGGVLQVGCSAVCQSLYIPLNQLLMDITRNYAHHNTGGSVLWGVQEGGPVDAQPTEYTHTFRLLANSRTADVRIRMGTVHDPVPEPGGDEGEQSTISLLGLDKPQIACEVIIAPAMIDADTGEATSSEIRREYKLKVFFNKDGGGGVLMKSSLYVCSKKKIYLTSHDSMKLESKKDMVLKAKDGITIDGGAFTTIKGGIFKAGKGSQPAAVQGSLVQMTLPFTPIPGAAVPLVLSGIILTGEPTVLF